MNIVEENTIGEEIMYGDIWQKEDYLKWLYERLLAKREVMAEIPRWKTRPGQRKRSKASTPFPPTVSA